MTGIACAAASWFAGRWPPARGRIVNISSQAAFAASQSGKTAYDSSKMGIVG